MLTNYFKELNTIVLHIENNLTSKISYDNLAQAVGFSVAHVRDIFRERFKKPLARYILERKIAHIASEMGKSDRLLIDLAFAYGFESYEVFNRAFKRVTKVTPSQFRKHGLVKIAHISSGVYGPIIIKDTEDCSMTVKSNIFSDCVLANVPTVNYGGGLRSSFTACLESCLAYIGQDIDYDYLMTVSGIAFRLRWNTSRLDAGNIGLNHIFDNPYRVYDLCFKASGRDYNFIKKQGSTKEIYADFIKQEIQQGKPCIALGIVGPPESCVITGYRDNGNKLLGYSMFQNDLPFCANTLVEESGYFVCSDWWRNGDANELKPAFAIGGKVAHSVEIKEVISVALEVMHNKPIGQFASGQKAYDEVIRFILNDKMWLGNKLESQLYEQVIVLGDIMVMLCQRASAAKFFADIVTANNKAKELFTNIAFKLNEIAKLPEKMCSVPKMGWNMSKEMIECICENKTRKAIADYFVKAKGLEVEIIDLLNNSLELGL